MNHSSACKLSSSFTLSVNSHWIITHPYPYLPIIIWLFTFNKVSGVNSASQLWLLLSFRTVSSQPKSLSMQLLSFIMGGIRANLCLLGKQMKSIFPQISSKGAPKCKYSFDITVSVNTRSQIVIPELWKGRATLLTWRFIPNVRKPRSCFNHFCPCHFWPHFSSFC